MHPVIQAIPTFGTCSSVTAVGAGINQLAQKYSSQLDGKDDRSR